MTREHFISANILEQMLAHKASLGLSPRLQLKNAGHFFGGRDEVEIGVKDFAAKVLCDAHNSALSDIDSAAGLAFSTILAFSSDVERVRVAGSKSDSFHVASGIDIERWMIKVYCGLVASGKIRGPAGPAISVASLEPELLKGLVGTQYLSPPLGLYMHSFVGQQRHAGGFSFGTIKLTDGSNGVGGLMLSLGLMSFVLVASSSYGKTFSDGNWYRHQALAFNIRHNNSRLAYLFTY
jgi:hypothetical protein